MDKQKKENELISIQPEILLYADKADLETLKYDELVELGRGVSEVKGFTKWLLGKLGNAVSGKYGDLFKFARDIREIPEVLQQYVYAYRKYTKEDPNFTPDRYYGVIPWGMLQLVATKSDTPVKLLNELVDKGATTIEGAYREIKTMETGKSVPKKPFVRFKWNEEKDKWKVTFKKEELDLIDWSDVKEQLVEYWESLA